MPNAKIIKIHLKKIHFFHSVCSVNVFWCMFHRSTYFFVALFLRFACALEIGNPNIEFLLLQRVVAVAKAVITSRMSLAFFSTVGFQSGSFFSRLPFRLHQICVLFVCYFCGYAICVYVLNSLFFSFFVVVVQVPAAISCPYFVLLLVDFFRVHRCNNSAIFSRLLHTKNASTTDYEIKKIG